MTLIKFIGLPVYAGYLISNFMITGNTGYLISGVFASFAAMIIKNGDDKNE